jgi:hypothetical protein
METNTIKTSKRPARYKVQANTSQEALQEAIENLAYWKRRWAIAINPTDKADCAARVSLWTSTRDARRFAGKEAGE